MSAIGPRGRNDPRVDAAEVAAEAAEAAELHATEGRWPRWLSGLDGTCGVRRLAERALRDGLLTFADVKALVTEAKDFKAITTAERGVLFRLLRECHDHFQPAAREALHRFLRESRPIDRRAIEHYREAAGASG
jgi:hypothetical protein